MDEMDVRGTLDELDLPLAECGEQVLMTVESVDKALDQVRPYLISDGGNVEVLNVANGIVLLRMEVGGAGRRGEGVFEVIEA
jgi:hypothetical protein